jgi:hypothetical protein
MEYLFFDIKTFDRGFPNVPAILKAFGCVDICFLWRYKGEFEDSVLVNNADLTTSASSDEMANSFWIPRPKLERVHRRSVEGAV